VFYPHPGNALRVFGVVAALVLLIGITALVCASRRGYLITGWFWFLGTMVPMIGLEGVGYLGMQQMADRYAYLPFIGLFIMVCWGAAELMPQKRVAIACVSALVVLVLGAEAHKQLGYWSDNAALWSRTLAVTDRNWLAENNLGKLLMSQGRTEEGVAHFLKATEIYPEDPVSNMNLGIWEQQHGNARAAIERYRIALSSSHDAALRLAAYTNMGRAYRDLGDTAHAEECFAAARTERGF